MNASAEKSPASPEASDAQRAAEKKVSRDRFVSVVSICVLLSFYAAFSLSTLADSFARFSADRLAWCGVPDALVVAGFLLGFRPVNFLRFAAFSVVGFALYLGWSGGYLESVSSLKAMFADRFCMVAGLHAAAGILSFRLNAITSAAVALAGMSFWHLPILLAILNPKF